MLDAERMGTELGPALVTTPEQTVLDLAHRPALGDNESDVRDAVAALYSRSDTKRLHDSPPTSGAWRPCVGRKGGPGLIMDPDERDSVAIKFGVATEQVERDHLISHILAFLSREFGDRLHFIGGTALARTHLPDGRLSEDIDLIAIGSRKEVANELDAALPRAVARTHGRLTVEPRLRATADTLPVLMRPDDGRPVRLQLLSAHDRVAWPTERRRLVQRYADAPAAELLVPTLPAFTASKTATWTDRHAPRDLWDL